MAAYTTIDDPSAYFHIQLYTGNGSSGLSITNDANAGNLQPDLLWIMPRSNGDNGVCFDSSRGEDKQLKLNEADAEDTHSPARITIESDGFDLDTTDTNYNGSSRTYVSWQWKCNGGSLTTNDASATSVGTIDSQYQANTTSGFSIVSYTGTGSAGTIAHGLGAVPSVMIVKNRSKSAGEGWMVYHHKNTSAPETDHLQIHNGNATSDNDVAWNDTAPTSTVFSVNNDDSTNDSGESFVGYFFKEIQGFSKFGSYIGNANADGAFIYTGFKPAWLMIKNTSATQSWWIFDNKRLGYNGGDVRLRADRNTAEDTGSKVDFVSNGFKWRDGDNAWNYQGNDFIYIAIAEHPFVSSKGVPVTAR